MKDKEHKIDIISLINNEEEFAKFFMKNEKKIRRIANKMLKLGIYGIVIHPEENENIIANDVAYR